MADKMPTPMTTEDLLKRQLASIIAQLSLTNSLLKAQLDLQRPDPELVRGQRENPPYNVLKLPLDTAQTDYEVVVPGDYLSIYTNGSYAAISWAVDAPTADHAVAGEFRDYYGHFDKLYLTWTAQAGKYARLFVGRGEQYRYKGN